MATHSPVCTPRNRLVKKSRHQRRCIDQGLIKSLDVQLRNERLGGAHRAGAAQGAKRGARVRRAAPPPRAKPRKPSVKQRPTVSSTPSPGTLRGVGFEVTHNQRRRQHAHEAHGVQQLQQRFRRGPPPSPIDSSPYLMTGSLKAHCRVTPVYSSMTMLGSFTCDGDRRNFWHASGCRVIRAGTEAPCSPSLGFDRSL